LGGIFILARGNERKLEKVVEFMQDWYAAFVLWLQTWL